MLEDGALGNSDLRKLIGSRELTPVDRRQNRVMPISGDDGKGIRFRRANVLASCLKIVCFVMHSRQTRVPGIRKHGMNRLVKFSVDNSKVELSC